MPIPSPRPAAFGLILIGLLSTLPVAALAGTSTNASVMVKVTLEDITNQSGTDPVSVVSVFAGAQPFQLEASASGPGSTAIANAVLDPEGLLPIAIGDSLSIDSSTLTEVYLRGSADAVASIDGMLAFENASLTDTFLVELTLEYLFSAAASTDLPAWSRPDGAALAQLYLFSDLLGVLADGAVEVALGEQATQTGAPEQILLTLGPGFVDNWIVTTDAASFAIPSPLPLALLLPGLIGLAARRRAP